MSTDDRDNDSPGDKKPPAPKQVVVTHYGKKKKESDMPSEIMPTEPKHIISSPVDIGAAMSKTTAPSTQPEQKPRETIMPAARTSSPRTADAPFQSVSGIKAEPKAEPKTEIFPEYESVAAQAQAAYSAPLKESAQAYGGGGYEPPKEDTERQVPTGGGGGSGGGALFFSVISLFAVIVLAYYSYSTYQQLSELQKQSTDDQSSVTALNEQTKKALFQLQEQSTKSVSEQQSLENLKKQILTAQSNLMTLSGNTDWVLAEANYLAFMANERLKTAQDVTTALAQLNSADERITRLGNPALLWVKDSLAKDIAKLKNFPYVNRQALWEQLGLINAEFNQLHFKSVTNGKASAIEENPKDNNMSKWHKALWKSWQELKSVIKVTQVAQNAIPLALTEQEQSQILRTLHMMTEQARWAILQGENTIYLQSLQSMKTWLNEYFAEDKMQKELLNQIAQLEQQNINIAVPDINESVQALSKAMIEVSNKPIIKAPQ